MKQTSFGVFVGLLLGLTAVAEASTITSPIQIAHSSYGIATSGGSACDGLCVLPPNVTVLEQNYAFSGGGGEVYDFDITSIPTDTTGFTLTLTGSAPFLDDSADNGHDFGAFVCKQLPAKTETQCGSKLPAGVTATVNSKKKNDVSSVTFTVDGDHEDLVFYAIEGEDALNTITADLTIHTSTIHTNVAGAPLLVTTPDPRFVSVLLAVLLLSAVSIHRRRQAGESARG